MVLSRPRDDLALHRSGMRGGRRRSPLLHLNIRPTRFEPRVRYKNETLLPLERYPRFRVPSGLTARMPFFVTTQQIRKLLTGRTEGTVAGLTKTEFSMRFADVHRQWKPFTRRNETMWEFQGGSIYLDIEIAVYVVEGYQPEDAARAKIFTIIMEHELLHVADEIDLIRNYLPGTARRDRQLEIRLIERNPLSDRDFKRWVRDRNGEGRTGFEDWIFGDWATEHNRRANARDSGQEWTRFRERIDTLMQGQPDPGPLR